MGNQTAILNAIGDRCLTLDTLVAAMPAVNRKNLINACCRLVERGLVERIERGCFRLTGDGVAARDAGLVIKSGPKGKMPRRRAIRNSLHSRLWRAMRLCRKFTIPALVELAARDERTPSSAAGRYVRTLERAGYLHRLSRREAGTSPTSNGFIRWTLVRDTGDQPPIPRGDGTVFDPNTNEVTSCRTG